MKKKEIAKADVVREDAPNKMRKIIISIGVLIILVVAFYLISGAITKLTGKVIYNDGKIAEFVNCLDDAGAKMYGAYWCGHCQNQKKMFGDDGKILVDMGIYVECDPNGENPQTDLCLEKGIKGYPTWEINGKFYPGKQSFEKLSELTGCKLN